MSKQLTGQCNPIRSHSCMCSHHGGAVTDLSLQSRRAAQVNTRKRADDFSPTHLFICPHAHSAPSSLQLPCSTNMSTRHPAKARRTACLTPLYLQKKDRHPSTGMYCISLFGTCPSTKKSFTPLMKPRELSKLYFKVLQMHICYCMWRRQ